MFSHNNGNHYNKILFQQISISVSVNDVISAEASSVNGILVVRLALVVACIFLCCRVDFHLRFHSIVTYWPFMNLEQSFKRKKLML